MVPTMGHASAASVDQGSVGLRPTTRPQLHDLVDFVASQPRARGLSLGTDGLRWGALPPQLAGLLGEYRTDAAGPTNSIASMELLGADDRRTTLSAFARCWRSGFAECTVQTAASPEPHALSLWDLREEVGTFIAVIVPGAAAEHPTVRPAPPPRLLVHTSSDLGHTLTADPAIERLLGWSVDEFLSRPRIDFVHPDDQTESVLSWAETLAAPGAVSRRRCRYRHKDGERWVWFEITTTNLLDTEGFVRCEMLDISESMAASDALYQREQLLSYLTESMPHGIVHLSSQGEVLFANNHLAAIAGTKASPIAFLDQVPREDRRGLYEAFERALQGTDSDVEGSIFRPDGTERRCHTRVRSLGSREAGVLVSIEDITDRWKQACELAERAATDALTGILNRRAILEALEQMQAEARSTGTATTVAFLDLNNFKHLNDEYGHRIGDRVLAVIAARLQDELGPRDELGRLGGDEFLVLCRDTDASQAVELGQRLREAVAAEIHVDGHTVRCTTSCGLATDVRGVRSVDALIHAADRSMYREKNGTSVR